MMLQVEKRSTQHKGVRAYVEADSDSDLVHTVIWTPASVSDVTRGHGLLRGEEALIFPDAGYLGVVKLPWAECVHKQIALHLGRRRILNVQFPRGALLDQLEETKASVRAKV